MRAVELQNSSLSFRQNYPESPPAGTIQVDVLKAGICETDLQLIRGYMGFSGVLGHEFVGIARSGKYAGQRVVGEINCACGCCEYCEADLPNHCPHRSVVGILNHDGAFADHVWIPEANLHAVPDVVSDDQAVFVEPLAAAFQIPHQLDLTQFEKVVVLGDGRLGNLCAQVIKIHHRNLLVVGKHAAKVERLASRGIETALLSELPMQRLADLVVDCTGSPSGLETAFRIIKPRGTLVLKSTFAGTESPNLAPVVIDELKIVGSRCGPFQQAIEALADQLIDVESLITSRFPLEAIEEAITWAQRKDQLKVLLDVAPPQG